ncbi:bifunctional 4-hydroxy-2-oxoglutarate aldolase/2-dehydro-3-deoxy-phosphogluconate aldolase [Galbibacter sp. BG1]|uniref:bifunctional 4-hydroxy-2-oxoglutarate aldolase/2-dehydro-3-deoxy-phosphogluconate aldolase n=1 Tax=Galbibacter sp. BG1 TaxID=1170699 RepID=UPI0015BE54AD|nr:bifunctional 4-hydroxy-2-oxoglutarate aldolase/2-dehydro-3-deoxy-phosphogluconate aldolase [Galbibacter sp. BG1]QLE02446.1 bifunctional 4-hydroxy-2-oxoglutarate aldolase/2-dehydro-3-deoxy-phosphogluconate aldolase [Galbibacter sp. BG1]
MITRIQISEKVKEIGFIPLFYNDDVQVCKRIIHACYEGGATVIEFTARGYASLEVFKSLLEYSETELPRLLLGVGSVTDAGAASLYMQMGAKFIVTPVLREDIAKVCNRRKVLWMPGCATLTEIAQAEELGCEIIKLFPGALYGPEFVKAIKGPQPWTRIMPTGGVGLEENSLKGWFGAGVDCVGLGSNLIGNSFTGESDFISLKKRVTEVKDKILKIRRDRGLL